MDIVDSIAASLFWLSLTNRIRSKSKKQSDNEKRMEVTQIQNPDDCSRRE